MTHIPLSVNAAPMCAIRLQKKGIVSRLEEKMGKGGFEKATGR